MGADGHEKRLQNFPVLLHVLRCRYEAAHDNPVCFLTVEPHIADAQALKLPSGGKKGLRRAVLRGDIPHGHAVGFITADEVRPTLQAHSGDIISSFEDGVVRFRLKGHCSGCPSAWMTAEDVIKEPMMKRFPALKDVVVDNDLDEEMIQLAKDVLSGKKKFL